MNGFKASKKTIDLDRHTFLAPSNVDLLDSVGKFLSIEIIIT